jgi:hypothetical protein
MHLNKIDKLWLYLLTELKLNGLKYLFIPMNIFSMEGEY